MVVKRMPTIKRTPRTVEIPLLAFLQDADCIILLVRVAMVGLMALFPKNKIGFMCLFLLKTCFTNLFLENKLLKRFLTKMVSVFHFQTKRRQFYPNMEKRKVSIRYE